MKTWKGISGGCTRIEKKRKRENTFFHKRAKTFPRDPFSPSLFPLVFLTFIVSRRTKDSRQETWRSIHSVQKERNEIFLWPGRVFYSRQVLPSSNDVIFLSLSLSLSLSPLFFFLFLGSNGEITERYCW